MKGKGPILVIFIYAQTTEMTTVAMVSGKAQSDGLTEVLDVDCHHGVGKSSVRRAH